MERVESFEDFLRLLERLSELPDSADRISAAAAAMSEAAPNSQPTPRDECSLFSNDNLKAIANETLPACLRRHKEDLENITKGFLDGAHGWQAAIEAHIAQNLLQEATWISCAVDPDIKRALQVGMQLAELATIAKHRFAEHSYAVGRRTGDRAKRNIEARKAQSKKRQPKSLAELERVMNAFREYESSETQIAKKTAQHYGYKPNSYRLVYQWLKDLKK